MEHTNSRKWIVIGGGVVLIVLIGFLLWLSLKSTPKTTSQTPFQNEDKSLVVPSPFENEWKTYVGVDYSISYPPDWNVNVIPQSSANTVIIKPSSNPEEIYPSITISSRLVASSPGGLTDAFYAANTFSSGSATVANQSAKTWVGSMFSDPQKGPVFPTQEQYERFAVGGKEYVMVYKYKGDQKDVNVEKTFQKIISSFNIF